MISRAKVRVFKRVWWLGLLLLLGAYLVGRHMKPGGPSNLGSLEAAGVGVEQAAGMSPTGKPQQDCETASPFSASSHPNQCDVGAERPMDLAENTHRSEFAMLQARSSHLIIDLLDSDSSDMALNDKLGKISHANTEEWVAFGIYLADCVEAAQRGTPRFAQLPDPICSKLQSHAGLLSQALAKNSAIDREIRAFRAEAKSQAQAAELETRP